MKTRPNQEIRDALKLYGLTQWDLCKALELSEMTLYRRLRDELPEDQKQEYMNAIKKLASINQGNVLNPMFKSGLVLFTLKEWELLEIETSK